ncbi:MAG TPA: envelope biogenesis factor ElyC, partial [Armatimonadota bacterium]|nr:envelope biogenesis factor ElyC [Armatimonadota bacterium]
MAFLLKKHLSPFLFPVPLCVLLLLAGVLLLWPAKNRRWGRALASAGLCVLLLGALPPFPEVGIRYLEAPWSVYKPVAGADVRWVVVLGGGVTVDPSLPPTTQLTRSSLVRLIEGIRILKLHPEARLLLS